jgi:hypothetical protein
MYHVAYCKHSQKIADLAYNFAQVSINYRLGSENIHARWRICRFVFHLRAESLLMHFMERVVRGSRTKRANQRDSLIP